MRFRRTALGLATVASILFTPAFAQEQNNTILVLDGSGSMWGQIEGTAKITIAQDVVGQLLRDLPASQNIGLTVYGHRERGNCADIETMMRPGEASRDQIAAAVNSISPRGKTPMTDAVRLAAEALRYTEEKATVILVSDGIETCNPDPCAAARVLEETGVDFTAHVIGFDITDPEALRQMQCLADETGGTFRSAANAAELAQALTTVAAAPEPEPEPEPVPVAVTLTAVIGDETGPVITDPVLWELTDDTGRAATLDMRNPVEIGLLPGSYRVTATWTVQEVSQTRQFISTDSPRQIAVVFDQPRPKATLIAPASAARGSIIELGWSGPAVANDFIGVGLEGSTGSDRWGNYVEPGDQDTVQLRMPPVPGTAVISYFSGPQREILTSVPITITDVPFDLTAPAQAEAGSLIELGWTGPDYPGDFIGIGPVGATGSDRWDTYVLTSEGSPTRLQMPPLPGAYEITYFIDQNRTPAHTVAITVAPVGARLTAPAQAVAGARIEVAWTGPDAPSDFIGIGKQGATSSDRWQTYALTRDGNPLTIPVPTEPGAYEITYFLNQDRTPLTSVALTVTEPPSSITVPAQAPAGGMIEVGWQGPDYPGDFIGAGRPGATGSGRWETYTQTREGNPTMLQVPITPGDYVVSYFLSQDRTAIASAPLTVTPVDATLSAPAEAVAGSQIEVGWDGPGYADDFLGIGVAGASGSGQWKSYALTRDGNPATLQVPALPGTYLITYFARQKNTPLGQTSLTVTPAEATLTAPARAAAGTEIEVAWSGPGYPDDFIGIGLQGATSSGQWRGYTLTRTGNPLRLSLPDKPGSYVIKYFMRQGNTPIAEVPITLE